MQGIAAPVLSTSGGTDLVWTWSDTDPDFWEVEQSTDGGLTWSNVAEWSGATRTDATEGAGQYRIIGVNALRDPITAYSNIVTL